MEERKCKKCGMPIEKPEEECSCEELVCFRCCSCDEQCGCGCRKKE